MSKLKSDSKWNELTDEQRDTLEVWLFEENISCRETLERIEKEFGIKASLPSLARFYQRLAQLAERGSVTRSNVKIYNHSRIHEARSPNRDPFFPAFRVAQLPERGSVTRSNMKI